MNNLDCKIMLKKKEITSTSIKKKSNIKTLSLEQQYKLAGKTKKGIKNLKYGSYLHITIVLIILMAGDKHDSSVIGTVKAEDT